MGKVSNNHHTKEGRLGRMQQLQNDCTTQHVSKVLMMVLLMQLKTQMEPHLSEEQAGFRKDRSTMHQILIMRLIAEKAKRKGRRIFNCFIDFQKAFDSIKHDVTWATFRSYGIGRRLICILQNICEIYSQQCEWARNLENDFEQQSEPDKVIRYLQPHSSRTSRE